MPEQGVKVENIFQLLITDAADKEQILPDIVRRNTESLRSMYPSATYTLLRNDDIRNFISANFAIEVVETYDRLRPHAYKADLARYCLMYALGGVYSDLGVLHVNPMELSARTRLVCFRDFGIDSGAPWAVTQTILLAVPGREEFRCAIEMVVEHGRERFYGANSLDPTGPLLFGRALAQVNRPRDLAVGEARSTTPDFHKKNVAFVSREGVLVAFRNKSVDGDIGHLGLSGTNRYNEIWNRRQVWGEKTIRVSHADGLMRAGVGVRPTADGLVIEKGHAGCRIFGPYLGLEAGTYRATLAFASGSVSGRRQIDVCGDVGRSVFAIVEPAIADAGTERVTIQFTLAERHNDVEVRLHSDQTFQGTCTGLEIDELPS